MFGMSETDLIPSFQQSLANLSLKLQRIIHPLFISKEERNLKLSIAEYRIAYENGEKIYSRIWYCEKTDHLYVTICLKFFVSIIADNRKF